MLVRYRPSLFRALLQSPVWGHTYETWTIFFFIKRRTFWAITQSNRRKPIFFMDDFIEISESSGKSCSKKANSVLSKQKRAHLWRSEHLLVLLKRSICRPQPLKLLKTYFFYATFKKMLPLCSSTKIDFLADWSPVASLCRWAHA